MFVYVGEPTSTEGGARKEYIYQTGYSTVKFEYYYYLPFY